MITYKSNTAESTLASGTVLTAGSAGNTGGAAGDFFNAVFASTGNSITYTTDYYHGSKAIRFLAAGGGSASLGWDEATAGARAAIYLRAYVKIKAFHTGNVTLINTRGAEGAASGYAVRITPAGLLQVVQSNGTVVLATTAKALALNYWYRIEVRLEANGTWGLRVHVGDGYALYTPELAGSGATSGMAGGFTFIRFGIDGTTVNAEAIMDDLGYGDSWMGPLTAGTAVSVVDVPSVAAGWLPVGAASILDTLGDEDAATYAKSPNLSATSQPILVRLGRLGVGDLSVKVRLGADGATAATRVRLLEGTRQVAVWTVSVPAGTAQDSTFALTAAESSSITDRSNLFVEIGGTL